MIDFKQLENLINVKKSIDESGATLQAKAASWAEELRQCVGADVFSKTGIDWCEICLKICKQMRVEYTNDDRCVCNDR